MDCASSMLSGRGTAALARHTAWAEDPGRGSRCPGRDAFLVWRRSTLVSSGAGRGPRRQSVQAVGTSLSRTKVMADPTLYTYPSPLEGYDKQTDPLPIERNEDGKSFKNPQHGVLSPAYDRFTNGISNGRRGGFDIHVYFLQSNTEQVKFARELWERIRREFPELRIYQVFDRPIGPHPVGTFEVNLFTPTQFGAFIPWLVINRGPLSALIHPNTAEAEEERNHTQRATWMGDRFPLDLSIWR